MTTELVILLALFVTVIVGVFKTPSETFDNASPRLGMRIEKQLETGGGFTDRTQAAPQAIHWNRKN